MYICMFNFLCSKLKFVKLLVKTTGYVSITCTVTVDV